MANNWNIPNWLEQEVRARDKTCVYCGVIFTPAKVSRKSAASWEHIINDASIITRENIALCCCGCNSSKGQKQLSAWLQSKYCLARGINLGSIAPIVRKAIKDEKMMRRDDVAQNKGRPADYAATRLIHPTIRC